MMENQKLLPVPELFKKSFKLYSSRMWVMLRLGLVSWASSVIIVAVFGLAGLATFLAAWGTSALNLTAVLIFLIGILLMIIVTALVQVALFCVLKDEYAQTSLKDLLKISWGKIGAYYWIVILRSLIVLAGCLLLIVPGIIFSVWFSLAPYVYIFEGLKGSKALSRSKELVKGRTFAVFGRLLLFIILAILVSSISRLGFLINSLFVMPFGIAYMYTMYEDLKMIKSGA